MSRPPSRDRAAAARSASMAGRGVFVVVVAAAIGLLVLKNGFADSGSTSGSTTTSTTAPSATTTVPGGTTVPSTVPADAPYSVLVANGSGVQGVATKTTEFLKTKGITTLPPTDATKSDYPETVVYFAEGYQTQAQFVAQQLGGVQVAGLIPTPPPVANLGTANVLVVVGKKPIPGVTG